MQASRTIRILAAAVMAAATITAINACGAASQVSTRSAVAPAPAGDDVRGIVNADGEPSGVYRQSDHDAALTRIRERMMAAGIRDTSTLTADQKAAFLIVEAVPVTTDGKVSGYFAGEYLTIDQYEQRRPEAERIVAEIEARQPG